MVGVSSKCVVGMRNTQRIDSSEASEERESSGNIEAA